MKSRKRGPAPPVVRGPLATRPGRRPPPFCSPPSVPPDPLERGPLPARSAAAPARRRGHRLPSAESVAVRSCAVSKEQFACFPVTVSRTTPHHDLLERASMCVKSVSNSEPLSVVT